MLVGNWSDDYSMGTSPTAWTGSVKILQQYANTGVPVCFAQCWVFAGVFNTCKLCQRGGVSDPAPRLRDQMLRFIQDVQPQVRAGGQC